MFRHLCSTCEKGQLTVGLYQCTFCFILAEHPPSERHAVEEGVQSIVDRMKVSIIGHLVLL